MLNQLILFVRQRYARFSFALAILLIYLASFYYLPAFTDVYFGFYIYLISLLLLYPSATLFPTYEIHAKSDRTSQTVIRPLFIGAAVVSISLLMMINIPIGKMTNIHLWLGMDAVPTWIQMVLLGIGIIGLAHGFGGRIIPRRFRWQRHHTVLLLIVTLGGLVRVWDIENTYHLFLDEILFMGDVYYIHTENLPILFPNYAPTTDAYTFFQSIMVTLFGPSITSQRLISALAGMTGLLVLYTFARQLFSLRVALISVLLYATLPVYVQFGRIGLYNVVDSIFGVIGFLYIVRGMRSGQLSDYALAGIAFGLTHYFYEGGRLFFTAYLICWLIWCHILARRDSMFRQVTWRQVFVLLFCMLILIIPIYHTLWQFEHPMTQRLVAVQTTESVIRGRLQTFLMNNEFSYLGAPLHQYVFFRGDDVFYQSSNAIILPILVPFFLLGFGRLLWQICTIRGSLLIWWIVGTSIANNLITGELVAQTPRHNVVYGVLMIVTALGIHTSWTLITRHAKLHLRRWVSVGVVCFLLLVTGIHIRHYFAEVIPLQYSLVYGLDKEIEQPKPAFDNMIRRAVELPDNTTVIVFTDWTFPKTHETIVPVYYGRDPEKFQVIGKIAKNINRYYFATLPRNVNYVFSFTRYHEDRLVDMIDDYFTISHIEGSPLYIPETVEMLFAHAPLSDNFIPASDVKP